MREWQWIGHTLRNGDESFEERALDWNLQGAKRRGRLRQTWKRTIMEEAGKRGKTWNQVRD